MTGSRDWVLPAEKNLPLYEFYRGTEDQNSATDDDTTQIVELPGADHRLEIPPGEDANGNWQFFQIHPEARELIAGFVGKFCDQPVNKQKPALQTQTPVSLSSPAPERT